MAQAWDSFIAKQLKAVPLNALHGEGLQLLDILVKVDSGGWFRRRDCVQRAGSMLSLGEQNVGHWKEMVEDPIKKGLDSLVVDGPKIEGFSKEAPVEEYQASIKASAAASLWASLGIGAGSAAGASIDVRGARSLTCRILKPTSSRVDFEFLLGLVDKPASYWRPDTSKNIFQSLWSTPHHSRKREMALWVVSEILYAQGVSVTADGETGLGIGVSTGISASPEAGMSISAKKDGGLLITARPYKSADGGTQLQPFPFAFRAVKLKYNDMGELLPIELRPVSSRISMFMALPEPSAEQKLFDTSLDDFFEHTNEHDDADELRCVEIKLQ